MAQKQDTGAIAVLGCGKIGEALVRGMLESGFAAPAQIRASARRTPRRNTGIAAASAIASPSETATGGYRALLHGAPVLLAALTASPKLPDRQSRLFRPNTGPIDHAQLAAQLAAPNQPGKQRSRTSGSPGATAEDPRETGSASRSKPPAAGARCDPGAGPATDTDRD